MKSVRQLIQDARTILLQANEMYNKSDKETVALVNIITCINAYLYCLEHDDKKRVVLV